MGAALCAASTSFTFAGAPSLGAHPRLLLGGNTIAQLKQLAMQPGSATAAAVAKCDDVIAHPANYDGGYEGVGFAEPFGACAIAWVARGDAASGAMAVTYFSALLDDYSAVGVGDGGDNVVQHDAGYSFRIFAPYAAIGYDWLQDAPGMTPALLAHARERFAAWTTWYAASGYHNAQPGANYHAGYVAGDTLIAVAEGNEAGSAGDALWDHVVNDIYGTQFTPAIAADGVLDGGDWLEGWEYGPLSVLELAMAARALRDNGVDMTPWAGWESALMLRTIYAQTPTRSGAYIGGDSQGTTPNMAVDAMTASAVLLDNASDDAKSWAAQLIHDQQLVNPGFPLPIAIGEASAPAAAAFPSNSSTWYYAPGSREVYARTSWDASAAWMVTQCAWHRVDDHMFVDAGNVVLTRGADDLVVDPSPYGTLSTLTNNAPTLSSPQLPADYQPSQAVWGAEANVALAWGNQRASGIVAARCDYLGQYAFEDTASDVPRAMRDLVLVPYGQGDAVLVVVDDTLGANASGLDVRFHAGAAFAMTGAVARAHVGGSDLVVQRAQLATDGAATPTISTPAITDCSTAPRGQCNTARFASGEWELQVPAQQAQATTVLDAVATGETPAAPVTSSGSGWRATELDRAGTHIAVIAIDPALTTVTYTAKPGSHVVVGAPAGTTGTADVSATANSGACVVTVTAHAGSGGTDARPLAMTLDASCAVTADPVRSPSTPDGGGSGSSGSNAGGSGSGSDGVSDGGVTGGCQSSRSTDGLAALLLVGIMLVIPRRRR